jgi:Zn-dependent peptidase ImmA (M78 family)
LAFKAPNLRRDDLERIADDFLSKYHSSRSIPVPIDRIIEKQFKIDIVPEPGLERNFDTVAYISSDLKTIAVDEYVYNKQPTRYRSSIAHELGHKYLHEGIYSEYNCRTIADWKKLVTEVIPNDQYYFLELQANIFAGLILVPTVPLTEEFENFILEANSSGIEREQLKRSGQQYVEDHLANYFEVSRDFIRHRLRAEKLWDQ